MKYLLTIVWCALLFTAHAQNPHPNARQEKKLQKAYALWRQGDSIYFSNIHYNYIAEEHSKIAARYFKKSLKQNPHFSPAMNGLGLALHKLNKREEAIHYFTKAIEEDNPPMAYNNRAMVYSELKQYQLALGDYRKSIQLDSMNFLSYYNLGCLYDDLKKYDSSIFYYTKTLSLNPDYLYALSNRGRAKMLSGDYEEALKDLNSATEKDPLNKYTINSRALTKYYLGLYEEAIIDFKKTLEQPVHGNSIVDVYAYNNMANCYFALGQNQKACELWKMAIENGYVYEAEWKETYKIDDPKILLLKYCK